MRGGDGEGRMPWLMEERSVGRERIEGGGGRQRKLMEKREEDWGGKR